MPHTVQPVLMTRDLDHLVAFYTGLFDAVEAERVPKEGPAFYIGLRIGDSAIGFVADSTGSGANSQRMLLSIEVDDPDAMLDVVRALGGSILGAPKDMPWGQRVAHVLDLDGNAVNLTRTA